jgi:DNA-binding transcriptional regulator of glucitol operon
MWHLLTLGAMATCGWLAVWQWERAGSAFGTAVNIGYGLQWPVFALFFGVMWWRMLRLEVRELRAAGADVSAPPVPVPPAREGPSPFTSRPRSAPAVADDEDPELAAYNRMLARLAERDRAEH